jgi:hypothetical protein
MMTGSAEVDTATWAIMIAAGAFILNIVDKVWGSGWKLSSRLTTIETSVGGMQAEISKLVDAVSKIADMRGDLRVLDTRLASAEQDIRELRHGDGFIRNRSPADPGVNREY